MIKNLSMFSLIILLLCSCSSTHEDKKQDAVTIDNVNKKEEIKPTIESNIIDKDADSAIAIQCVIGLDDSSFVNGKGKLLLQPERTSHDNASQFAIGVMEDDAVFSLVYISSENEYIIVNELMSPYKMRGILSMVGKNGFFGECNPLQSLFSLEDEQFNTIKSLKNLVHRDKTSPIFVYCKSLYNTGYLHLDNNDGKSFFKFIDGDKSNALKLKIYFKKWLHS